MTAELISLLAEILECEAASLSGDTRFREHEGWNSLAYLSIVAMIDERFDLVVTQENFRSLHTIAELAAHVTNRRAS